MQVAQKVVGVGSVGMRAWGLLLDAMDDDDPLFLQTKEARLSVLAGYRGRATTTRGSGLWRVNV